MITDHICEWSLPTGETLRILANLAEARRQPDGLAAETEGEK